MGSEEALVGPATMVSIDYDDKESDNLGFDFAEDFDSYMEDISVRFIVSRMVSDSVIRGIVNAVECEAEEKVEKKEMEMMKLKQMVNIYHMAENDAESLRSSIIFDELRKRNHDEQDRISHGLSNLRDETTQQLNKLREAVDCVRGSDVDKIIDGLKNNVDSIFEKKEDVVSFSRSSVREWCMQKEFEEDIEKICYWGMREEFEHRLWDQNVIFYSNESVNRLEEMKEISSLRQQLDIIYNLLFASDTGHQPHETLEKNGDCFHQKVCGKNEDLTVMAENLDFKLNHLQGAEIVKYLKDEMTKMKRCHESEVQKLTEEIFTLKRDPARDRGSSQVLRKDKEFEVLRKKIDKVVSKLDNYFVENKKLSAFSNYTAILESLNGRLQSLLVENSQQRHTLANQKRKIELLSSHISDDEKKNRSQISMGEEKLLKVNANLDSSMEDMKLEASLEGTTHEPSQQDIYFHANPSVKYSIEYSDMESVMIMMQDIWSVVFKESIKEAEEKLSALSVKCITEAKSRTFLEMEIVETEKALRLQVTEKTILEEQISLLEASLLEKDVLMLTATDAFEKERKQLAQEVDDLKDQEKVLTLERGKQEDALKSDSAEALKQVDWYKTKMCELKQKIASEVEKSDELNRRYLTAVQEKQDAFLVFEMKENENKKHLQSIIALFGELLQAVSDLDCKITKDFGTISSRIDDLSYQVDPHSFKINKFNRMGLLYKQAFENKCVDLQKAEAEVDLLGDEVESLLNLLEKIYIGLDHYSIVLQHYPGIMEALKLVNRELSGKSRKVV